MRRGWPWIAGMLAAAVIVALAVARCGLDAAWPLAVGDVAPAIDVSHWLHGDRVDPRRKGRITVVECWATWCELLAATFPRLDALQRRYAADGVRAVAVDAWDDVDRRAAVARRCGRRRRGGHHVHDRGGRLGTVPIGLAAGRLRPLVAARRVRRRSHRQGRLDRRAGAARRRGRRAARRRSRLPPRRRARTRMGGDAPRDRAAGLAAHRGLRRPATARTTPRRRGLGLEGDRATFPGRDGRDDEARVRSTRRRAAAARARRNGPGLAGAARRLSGDRRRGARAGGRSSRCPRARRPTGATPRRVPPREQRARRHGGGDRRAARPAAAHLVLLAEDLAASVATADGDHVRVEIGQRTWAALQLADAAAASVGTAHALSLHFVLLARTGAGAGRIDAAGRAAVAALAGRLDGLESFARQILTDPALLPHARPTARLAAEAMARLDGHDAPTYLDTMALARFENGDVDGAIELQQRVVAAVGEHDADAAARLHRYRETKTAAAAKRAAAADDTGR